MENKNKKKQELLIIPYFCFILILRLPVKPYYDAVLTNTHKPYFLSSNVKNNEHNYNRNGVFQIQES